MLSKKRRLNLRHQENLDILRKAKRVNSEYFTLYYFYDRAESSKFRTNESQVAVTVSKKVEKLAVDRNKLKRQLYSIVEKIMDENGLWEENIKIILVTRKSLKGEFGEMKSEVKKLFGKISYRKSSATG